MAEAASLAAIMTNVQSGLQTVLNARSDMIREVHDATTKRGLTKLNRFFLNAQLGEFTEEGETVPRLFEPPCFLCLIVLIFSWS